LLVAVLLVACETARAPHELPRKAAPRAPPTEAEMLTMNDFVRVVDDVPLTARELQAWLIGASYRAWPHESAMHPSSGPHAETVLTFLSPSLAGSLQAKASAHPRGAASVKELYKKGKHVGWAVSVKTAADSADGKNWFWYEVLSTAPDAKAPHQGLGLEVCRDCHAAGSDGSTGSTGSTGSKSRGVDQVLIEFPLR